MISYHAGQQYYFFPGQESQKTKNDIITKMNNLLGSKYIYKVAIRKRLYIKKNYK